MAHETSKAMRRRFIEDKTGGFPWMSIFATGKGIDVGCGPDKVPFDNFVGFDMEDGDANNLDDYFHPESIDIIHGSQIAEHLVEPAAGIRSWLRVLKPGGYLIVTVPDFVLYEHSRADFRFNPDHKSTWSMSLPATPCPQHCYLPKWLDQFPAEVAICRVVDTNYDYTKLGTVDQTWHEDDGVEAFIEFVLIKK